MQPLYDASSGKDGDRRVKIFDTTLRDGEQAPGFSMSPDAKIKMARALAALKVDIIEAGFAAASPGDLAAVRRVATEISGPTVCSLSRTREGDIRAAEDALKPAGRSRLHIFIGTSPTHRDAKLKMTPAQVLKEIEFAVSAARSVFDEVEFSAEDALRTERAFLCEALECAAKAGADVLNVPDTVGYTSPGEIYDLFKHLIEKVEHADHVDFSAHCHNDLGMAVANSLAAVAAGARQVECTINGIGERAGNCALEEVVMALHTRRDYFELETAVATEEIYGASKLLGALTGQQPARNKAIVGRNAFAHEAGIHQHGVLEDRRTYEIMTPADVGVPSNELVLGKHSGKHALKARIADLGLPLPAERVEEVFTAFKALADQKKEITDADLRALVTGDESDGGVWRIVKAEMRFRQDGRGAPSARVALEHADRGVVTDIRSGDGPFDAVFNTLCAVTDVEAELEELAIAQTAGQATASVRVSVAGATYQGERTANDLFLAVTEAIVAAFNQFESIQAEANSRLRGAA